VFGNPQIDDFRSHGYILNQNKNEAIGKNHLPVVFLVYHINFLNNF
jgi:hypothetical protein